MAISQRLHACCGSAGGGLRAAPFALAGTTRKYERARPFAIRHLALDLGLHPAKKAISGAATLDFERVSPTDTELVLDAVGFELHRVRIDTGSGWSDAPYQYDGDQIRISIPARVERNQGFGAELLPVARIFHEVAGQAHASAGADRGQRPDHGNGPGKRHVLERADAQHAKAGALVFERDAFDLADQRGGHSGNLSPGSASRLRQLSINR